MADLSPDELQGILREQNELRLRLAALDRKIETLTTASPPPLPVASAPAPLIPNSTVVSAAPSTVAKPSWEFQLGTVWLVRIGIVILLTGLVFLGNYAYHHILPQLSPWVKLAVLYFLGGGLAWFGARLEKNTEALRNYGRVLLAGGAALIYYTTYGATFVRQLHVIDNPLVGGFLLLGIGAVVVWLAEKRQAQSVALTAILLSYYTSAINPLGWFSLYSSLILTGAAVYFLLRHRWTMVSFLSLAGTYGSYIFWRWDRPMEAIWPAAGFLLGYWILFTAAVFLSRAEAFSSKERTPFLTVNNAAFYGLVFQLLHSQHPEWTGRFSLGFGAILLLLAWLARRRESGDLFLDGAYLAQGLGVLTYGLLTELHGDQLTLALTIQGTVLLCGMNGRHGWIRELSAGAVTLLAFSTDFTNNAVTSWALFSLLIVDGWLSRNWKKAPSTWNLPAVGYCALAVWKLSLLLPIHFGVIPEQLTAVVLLLALGWAIRLPELSSTSQLLILNVAVPYLLETSQTPIIGVIFLALLAILLFLTHWWQHQKTRDPWHIGQIVFFALFVAVISRWLDFSGSPFPKTLAWALIGAAALGLGLAIRERTYRLCGFGVLALAIGRVFLHDIWGLDLIFQILSFIVLGVVLLSLGFIYNKFADKLKEWL
ncbi:MAG: DUF2339 domain-containing protein [Chthoniobacterales bacterium]